MYAFDLLAPCLVNDMLFVDEETWRKSSFSESHRTKSTLMLCYYIMRLLIVLIYYKLECTTHIGRLRLYEHLY